MAESLGKMVIGVTADATGVTSAFQSVQGQTAKFAADVRQQGTQAAGVFDSIRGSVGRIFSELKTGNFGGVASEAKSLQGTLAALGGEGAASFSRLAIGAGLVAGAVAGIVTVSRSVSAELSAFSRFADRIGATTAEAGTLRRVFQRGGVEDPERTVAKFSDRLGDALRDREGTTADSFRQLGLTPERLEQLSPVQSLRETVEALGRVGNAAQRASLAQAVLGKEFVSLQEVIRLGGRAVDEAAERERLFGPGKATIDAAVQAQSKWRETGLFFQDIWDSFGAAANAVFSRVSNTAASLAVGITRSIQNVTTGVARVLLGLPKIDEVPTLGRRAPAAIQSAGLVQGERAIDQLRRRSDLEDNLTSEVQARGLVSANATRQEIDLNRQLLQQEDEILRNARARGLTAAEEPAFIDKLRAQTARDARRLQQKAADDAISDIEEGHRLSGGRLRTAAETLGFTNPGALAADAEQVRNLVQAFDRFQRSPGRTADEIERMRSKLARIASEQRNDTAKATNDEQERAGFLRVGVELYNRQGLAQARARTALQELLDLQRGISAQEAARTRRLAEQADLLDRRNAIITELRTPLDDFRDRFAEVQELARRGTGINGFYGGGVFNPLPGGDGLTGAEANLARGSAFLRLEQSLAPQPSSFAVNAATRGSIEEARQLADIQGRALNKNQDPQERVRAVLEEANRQRNETNRLLREIGQAVADSPLAAAEE